MSVTPPVDYIERTREQYAALGYPPYRWVVNEDEPPFTPLARPLSESTVALIASGGIYRLGQRAFHFHDDVSFRAIPRDTPESELRVNHFAYDMTDARRDINVVFPLATLRDLARLSRIGALARNAYTFMGGIYSARRVREQLAPALADQLVRDEVDVTIMVPA
jgi:D-proline reductase (dithiol) PrdB